MQLSKFKLMPTRMPDGVQAVLSFGKYHLSIVKSDYSYGGSQGLYEIGVFEHGHMIELPGITAKGDTVKGYLTEKEVDSIIKKMHSITKKVPYQI